MAKNNDKSDKKSKESTPKNDKPAKHPAKAGKRKLKTDSKAPKVKTPTGISTAFDPSKFNLTEKSFLVQTLDLTTFEVKKSKLTGAEIAALTPDTVEAPMFAWFKELIKETATFFVKVVFMRPHKTGCPYRVQRVGEDVLLYKKNWEDTDADPNDMIYIRHLKFGEFPEEIIEHFRKRKAGVRTQTMRSKRVEPLDKVTTDLDPEFAKAMGLG